MMYASPVGNQAQTRSHFVSLDQPVPTIPGASLVVEVAPQTGFLPLSSRHGVEARARRDKVEV
jgi:hypothetical protein